MMAKQSRIVGQMVRDHELKKEACFVSHFRRKEDPTSQGARFRVGGGLFVESARHRRQLC